MSTSDDYGNQSIRGKVPNLIASLEKFGNASLDHKMMKSPIIFVLTFVLLLGLASCNRDAYPDTSISPPASTFGVRSPEIPPKTSTSTPNNPDQDNRQTVLARIRETKTARATMASPSPVYTITPSFTPTPYPALSQSGPYLVYLVNLPNNQKGLRLLDADGTGRKTLPLPDDAYIDDVQTATSFASSYIAFYTGTLQQEPYDLAISIMHLPDGEIIKTIPLLSDEYPNNFDTIASILLQNPDSDLGNYYDDQSLSDGIRYLFASGIYRLAWSPAGRYLAFPGQMDGPSSDIYVYDSQADSITQRTDGLEQICDIHWSPDGTWILHEASNDPGGAGWTPNIFAVRYDASITKALHENMYFWAWLTPSTYAVYHSENGPGDYGLQLMDIESDRRLFYWYDSFQSFALDPLSNIVAISNHPLKDQETKEGIYLVYPDGSKKFVAEGYWGLEFWGGKADHFIGVEFDGIYRITKDSKITKFSSQAGWPSISPNNEWMLTYRNDGGGVDLYSAEDGFIRSISDHDPSDIIWRPDSNAIFYRIRTDFYMVSIPDGKPTLVDSRLVVMGWQNNYDYGFAWIK